MPELISTKDPQTNTFILFQASDPPTRRSHKKSRNGCRKCKDRKLKCDEIHPVCGNCARLFVTIQACDYSSVPAFRKSPARDRPLAPKGELPLSTLVHDANAHQSMEASEGDDVLHTALCPSINGGMLDPFETHPQSRVSGVDVLMKHYLRTAVYKSFPWQPASDVNPTTTYYVPLVWTDEVLFHAILELSASRMENHCPIKRDVAAPHHIMGECIRLLAERVQDPVLGISDQTISAVATLASIEHEKGNLRMLKMHLDGLLRMINIRGGLNAIRETNPMVANSVFWSFAIASYEVPYPNLDPELPFSPSFEDLAELIVIPTPLDLETLGVAQSIAAMLLAVQHVSWVITTHASYQSASASLIILTRMCNILSHLLSLPPTAETHSVSVSVSESARYGILLHVFSPWRGLPPDGTLAINGLLHKLKAFLQPLLANSESNELILWLLAVGGVSADGMIERTWFVGHLAAVSKELHLDDWQAVKSVLIRVIWHEKLCEARHRKLWDEVEVRRRLLEGKDVESGAFLVYPAITGLNLVE